MTEEELKAKLDAALASIEKLETKNRELQNEKQAAKTAAEEAREAAETAAEEKARAANDLAAVEAALTKKFQKQIDTLTQERDGANGQLHQLLVENGITNALTQAKVAPQFMSAAAALLKTSNKIEIANGAATIDGTPLADFVSDWAKGDGGKHFVAAPLNGGGGSTGSSAAATAGWTADTFNSRMGEFNKIAMTDKAQAIQIAESVGRADLVQALSQ